LMLMHPSDSSIMHAMPERSRNSLLDPFVDGDIAFTEMALNEITRDLVDATETIVEDAPSKLNVASSSIPPPFETDVLRITLTELLKENEALRLALQISPTAVEVPAAVPKVAVAVQPPPPPPVTVIRNTKRLLDPEARKVALERYRSKRQRRIAKTPHLQGPKFMKYKKMKKVADGKRRNSEGKFIKKADLAKMRLAEEAAQRAAEEVPSIEIPLCHQILVQ